MMPDPVRIIRAETDADFDRVFTIRSIVFGEELQIEEEIDSDGLDHLCHHYLAIRDGEALGTIRWRLGPLSPVARLERLAVLPDYRGQGLGKRLIQAALADIPSSAPIRVEALARLVPVYEAMGFRSTGEPYEAAGHDHQEMEFAPED